MTPAHALDPVLVYPGSLALETPPGWRGVALPDLLGEPPRKSPQWIGCSWARLAVAATGPVAVGGADLVEAVPGGLDRLRAAGWPVVARGADVAEARRSFWPTLGAFGELGREKHLQGAGSLAPRLVLVGEREPRYTARPFLSRSGVWLLAALRDLGYDELTVYVTNAFRGQAVQRSYLQRLHEILAPRDPTWVALGRNTARALRGAGIEHVYAHHPAASRRFRSSVGPQGYARHLRGVGIPPGPWRGSEGDPAGPPLPTVPVEGLTELAVALGMPGSVAYRKDEGARADRRAASSPRVDSATRAARLAYVTGEAATIRAAAEATGAAYGGLLIAARDEDWEAEREEYQRRVRERTLGESAEKEAQALVASRRLAATALARALQQVTRRLQDGGDLVPGPREAESLARTWCLLAERGDPGVDQELDRLRRLPLAEQIQAAMAGIKGIFGDDVLPGVADG